MTRTRSAVATRADEIGLGRPSKPTFSVVDQMVADRGSVQVPLSRLAPDPTNIRDDMGDLDGLAATIRGQGVFQALIVCTVGAFNLSHPEHLVDDVLFDYVVLDGHRRRAAGFLADQIDVPVTVHDEWAGISKTTLQLVTALHAQRLSPVAFAEGIRDLRAEHNLRQGDVGPFLGLKLDQQRVSDLEKILRYPEFLKDLLRSGLPVDSARHLASLDDTADGMQRAYALMTREDDVQLTAAAAVETVQLELTHETNAAASLKRLTAGGITVIDPVEQWGSKTALHELGHDELVRAVERQHKTCLAAAISTEDGLIDWYCLDPASHGILDPSVEARRARGARKVFVEQLVQRWAGVPAAAYELADAVVAAARPGSTLRLALGWAVDAGILRNDQVQGLTEDEILDSIRGPRGLNAELRVKLARLLTIAADEAAVRRPGDWGPRELAYLKRLQDPDVAGYRPTLWETDQINRLEADEVEA